MVTNTVSGAGITAAVVDIIVADVAAIVTADAAVEAVT